MNDAEIERRLGAMATPVLPANWKAGILAAAQPPARDFGVEQIAWSALAAGWLLIVTLRVTTPVVAPPDGPTVSGGEMAEHWRQVRHYVMSPTTPEESPATRIHLEQEFILPLPPRS